jgi:exodeoxyribonuclease VIII
MDAATEKLSADLRAELAANERTLVDPRTVPARFSNLKAVAISGAHGFASFQGGHRETLALRIGAGLHAMLFGLPVIALPSHIKQRRGKAWDAFNAENQDKLILTRRSHETAARIAESVHRHPIAEQLLFGPGTIHEQTILWSQLGRARRSTPDVRGPIHLCELKSTRCSEPGKFTRDAAFRSYHVQLADQRAAILAETGRRVDEVYIVAVESVEPFAVTVMQLSDRSLAKGEHLARLWLEQLILCERTDRWPAYSEGIELLDVPDDSLDLYDDPEAVQWSAPPDDAEAL